MTYNASATDPQINKQPLLTISIVTFNPDFDELKETLDSLKTTPHEFAPESFSITIVDNSLRNKVTSYLLRNYPELVITQPLIEGLAMHVKV